MIDLFCNWCFNVVFHKEFNPVSGYAVLWTEVPYVMFRNHKMGDILLLRY